SRQGEEVDPDHGPDHVDLRPDGWDVDPRVSYGRAVRQSHLRLEPHRQADARWQHRLPGDASHRPGPGSTRRELPAVSPIPCRLLFGEQANDTLLRVVCVDVHERYGQSPDALHGRGNSLPPDPKYATRPPRRLRPQRPPRRLLHRSRVLGALLRRFEGEASAPFPTMAWSRGELASGAQRPRREAPGDVLACPGRVGQPGWTGSF